MQIQYRCGSPVLETGQLDIMIRNVLTTFVHSNTQHCVFTHVDNPWLSSSVKTNPFSSRGGLDACLIVGEEISLFSSSSLSGSSQYRDAPLTNPLPVPFTFGRSVSSSWTTCSHKGGYLVWETSACSRDQNILEGTNPCNKVSWAAIYSQGTVFLHGTAHSVPNRHMGLKPVSGREETLGTFSNS